MIQYAAIKVLPLTQRVVGLFGQDKLSRTEVFLLFMSVGALFLACGVLGLS